MCVDDSFDTHPTDDRTSSSKTNVLFQWQPFSPSGSHTSHTNNHRIAHASVRHVHKHRRHFPPAEMTGDIEHMNTCRTCCPNEDSECANQTARQVSGIVERADRSTFPCVRPLNWLVVHVIMCSVDG
jgi:hypothetical protein